MKMPKTGGKSDLKNSRQRKIKSPRLNKVLNIIISYILFLILERKAGCQVEKVTKANRIQAKKCENVQTADCFKSNT